MSFAPRPPDPFRSRRGIPGWRMVLGDATLVPEPGPSLVISRTLSAEQGTQTYVPARLLQVRGWGGGGAGIGHTGHCYRWVTVQLSGTIDYICGSMYAVQRMVGLH